jgi:hypothetical protein
VKVPKEASLGLALALLVKVKLGWKWLKTTHTTVYNRVVLKLFIAQAHSGGTLWSLSTHLGPAL